MSYLLDTDICIYWLKGNKDIERTIISIGLENVSVSFITLSELYYGAYKSQKVKENLAAIIAVSDNLGVIESNEEMCGTFGKLKASLEKEGQGIDDADLFIAACALINNTTLVTNNEKHFKRIKGLKLENWVNETKD